MLRDVKEEVWNDDLRAETKVYVIREPNSRRHEVYVVHGKKPIIVVLENEF
jgi:hypothetical protein